MTLRKWDFAWAILDPTTGHEQSGRRPVLVFCNDAIAAPIGLVTVLPLTARRAGRRIYPTEVLLPSGTGGIAVDSLALAHQVRTISARRLSTAIGSLSDPGLRSRITSALRIWLDLSAD